MDYFIGYIDQIIFKNDDTGFVVANFVTDEESFPVRGVILGAAQYLQYRIGGRWMTHPRYGEQFEVQTAEYVEPENEDQIFAFLSSGMITGVGETIAAVMMEAFGTEILDIIEHQPNRLLSLPGIGPKKLKKIHDSYMNTVNVRRNLMFFYSLGVSTDAAIKMMESLGANAVAMITENPYILIDKVKGYAFKKADRIAARLGIEKDSEYRVRACITAILKEHLSDGHTYSHIDDISSEAEKYEISRELTMAVMFSMAADGILLLSGENRVSFFYIDQIESEIAERLGQLCERANPLRSDPLYVDEFARRMGIGFDQKQAEAINAVFREGVFVITGGPGTGKTTIVKAIIGAFEKQGREVILCAPTGRAAKKLADATNRTAKTIHRTLGANGEYFLKGADDPLQCDAVIVDEVSMVDAFLMNSLLRAIRPGTSLIIVGDKDQLPSVGAGSVFRDILQSRKIHVATLTHIFRQSEQSMISMNARRIIQGRMPANGEDFYIFGGGEELGERVVDMVTAKIPERFGFDPMSDIQVLSVKYDGEAGVRALNEHLKLRLNPGAGEKGIAVPGGHKFCVGDKVMQTSNQYDIEWEDQDGLSGKGIFNGDIGVIQQVNAELSMIRVEFDDGRSAWYQKTDLAELTHAYAITVHKSQGSEYPCVVIPIFSAYALENRNILYTAVTRAKKLAVLMGDTEVLKRFVNKISIDNRRSTLSEKLVFLFDHNYQKPAVSE